MVTFLNTPDAFAAGMGLNTVGDPIRLSRRGATSTNNDGTVVADPVGFTYSGPARPGDSGSAVLMHFDNKRFIFGSIMSVTDTPGGAVQGPADGILFTLAQFQALMTHLEIVQAGDVSRSEPTNLMVGSNAVDTAAGSYRADIYLGRDGNDTISDGDQIGDAVWANDQLFGGAGDDTLTVGAGNDLIHGGDHRVYPGGAAARLPIEDDGEDSVSYAAETHAIKLKLIATNEGDQTHRTTPDFAKSVFVETARDTNNDTLISIEKIAATTQTDTIYIKTLTADQVAGTDNKGGLLEVDLATNPTGRDNGDLIDATDMTAGIKVDLAAGRIELVSDAAIGFKVLNGERITGGKGNDDLTGNDSENVIKGGEGDDKIKGGGEKDLLEGDKGIDDIDGEAGDDTINGGEGDDVLKGGEGDDTIDGGLGNDTITGGAGTNILNGGEGNDTIDGVAGGAAAAGFAAMAAGGSGDTLDGGGGNDSFKTDNGDLIAGVESGDSITLNGRSLAGGEREAPPEDPCAPRLRAKARRTNPAPTDPRTAPSIPMAADR